MTNLNQPVAFPSVSEPVVTSAHSFIAHRADRLSTFDFNFPILAPSFLRIEETVRVSNSLSKSDHWELRPERLEAPWLPARRILTSVRSAHVFAL
ncbi:hypothetical protein [Azospirillum agricola]|uniref:hypothetical protein n=1 Tax=Azospirillum agricola TaxID=1720247 RepID=UPI001B3B883C|nr:hypothetical protein [Azospirillum agricola]